MPIQIYTNLRERLLCTLDASETYALIKGPEAAPAQPLSQYEISAVMNEAPYESSTQRRLQSLHLLLDSKDAPVGGKGEDIGVVVEFGVESGIDALAAYSDGVTAWFNSADGSLTEATLNTGAKQACENLMAMVVQSFIGRSIYVMSFFPRAWRLDLHHAH